MVRKIVTLFVFLSFIFIGGCHFEDDVKTQELSVLDPKNNCLVATSDCNACSRESLDDEVFMCTEAFCENEKFECRKYG